MDQLIDTSKSRALAAGGVNWRLFFKAVIKSGLVLGRNVQGMGQGVYVEANKLVAEARAELDREQRTKIDLADRGGSE